MDKLQIKLFIQNNSTVELGPSSKVSSMYTMVISNEEWDYENLGFDFVIGVRTTLQGALRRGHNSKFHFIKSLPGLMLVWCHMKHESESHYWEVLSLRIHTRLSAILKSQKSVLMLKYVYSESVFKTYIGIKHKC